jgi:hypothetical protein
LDGLFLATGIDDDARQPLFPGHSAYRFFVHAQMQQDMWSNAQHRAFWTDHVRPARKGFGDPYHWPRRAGRPPVKETAAWWAFVLAREGLCLDEIAQVLYPNRPDSFRRMRVIDRARQVYEEKIVTPGSTGGRPWRVMRTGHDPEPVFPSSLADGHDAGHLHPPLPRIFDSEPTDHDVLAFAQVNLPVTALANIRPPAALRMELRASKALAAVRGGS